MKAPSVRTTVHDKKHKVTYHVIAYRKLTAAEAAVAIGVYKSQPRMRRRKTPERNKTITILSVLGHEGT